MTRDQIKAVVLRTLGSIAPEADLSQIDPDAALRDQLDIDSMDFLNFAIGLHKELSVEIPEASYPALATLNGCIEYLTSALDAVIEAKVRVTAGS
jgi:acyl carrier protein